MKRILFISLSLSLLLANTKTIAISYFDNTSDSKEYNPLSKGLADMLITDLSNVKSIQIVEREKLESLLKEIDLGEGKFIDPNTAQKLGKGLGAEYMLTGSYLIMGETMRIDARLVDVATGEVTMAEETTGRSKDFMILEKKLAIALTSHLEIDSDLQTNTSQAIDISALLNYSKAIDFSDKGLDYEATNLLESTVQDYPEFSLAKDKLDDLKKKLDEISKKQDDISQQITNVDYKMSSGFDNLEDVIKSKLNPSNFMNIKPVIVYENSHFRGKSSFIYFGEHSNIGKLTLLNDKISSIEVNKGYQLTIYEHGDFKGKSVTITSDQPNLGDLNWNDKISSIKVEKYNQDSDAAIAYEDGDFKGKSLPLSVGNYNDLGRLTWQNDKISSIVVNKGYQLTIYEHGDFKGKSVTITSDQPNLGDLNWNDKISSIKIKKY